MLRTLSPGLEMATVSGDPMAEGQAYSVMLRLAPGRWIAPHWHPNEKVVAVMSGTLLFGHGETLDSAGARAVTAGGTVRVPATARHFEGAHGQTLLLLSGMGPLRSNPVAAGRGGHGGHGSLRGS
ncbi:MAG TPA: cupin domain-containing protein [Gemmatimonadaceae bacterium]|nr:cupin domain-containing protein [Gemmatimonadaceae bacterium]